MSTERSDKVHEHWRQSSEKFDYFVTGITGALCAYISQTFLPQPISISPSTLELIALLTLVASVFAGFKRIENSIETHRHSHSSLYLSEQIGQLVTQFNGGPLINRATGEVIPPEVARARVEALKEIQPTVEANADKCATAAGKWYTWRNWLLASGFLMLVASKVWSAYVCA